MALKNSEIRRKWKSQEKQAAKNLGGKLRARSGADWRAPGDVVTGSVLLSCKRTDGASIAVTDKHLKKHVEDAMMEDKTPVWEFEVGGKKYYMFCANDVEFTQGGGMQIKV